MIDFFLERKYNMTMFSVTEKAKKYLLEQLQQQDKHYVKLTVKGGGCAGFSYDYSFTDATELGDFVVDLDGNEHGFVVDGMSLLYVAGTELDYITDLAGSSLKLTNPNETSSCGCGKSFAI